MSKVKGPVWFQKIPINSFQKKKKKPEVSGLRLTLDKEMYHNSEFLGLD